MGNLKTNKTKEEWNELVDSIKPEFVEKQKIESLFVPYEESLELKELGFDEHCFGYYKENQYGLRKEFHCYNSDYVEHLGVYIAASTFSQAFRWFRKKYKLESVVQKADDFIWYKFTIYLYLSDSKGFVDSYHEFKTYEEAELACLIKLIEIVKNANKN